MGEHNTIENEWKVACCVLNSSGNEILDATSSEPKHHCYLNYVDIAVNHLLPTVRLYYCYYVVFEVY